MKLVQLIWEKLCSIIISGERISEVIHFDLNLPLSIRFLLYVRISDLSFERPWFGAQHHLTTVSENGILLF